MIWLEGDIVPLRVLGSQFRPGLGAGIVVEDASGRVFSFYLDIPILLRLAGENKVLHARAKNEGEVGTVIVDFDVFEVVAYLERRGVLREWEQRTGEPDYDEMMARLDHEELRRVLGLDAPDLIIGIDPAAGESETRLSLVKSRTVNNAPEFTVDFSAVVEGDDELRRERLEMIKKKYG